MHSFWFILYCSYWIISLMLLLFWLLSSLLCTIFFLFWKIAVLLTNRYAQLSMMIVFKTGKCRILNWMKVSTGPEEKRVLKNRFDSVESVAKQKKTNENKDRENKRKKIKIKLKPNAYGWNSWSAIYDGLFIFRKFFMSPLFVRKQASQCLRQWHIVTTSTSTYR